MSDISEQAILHNDYNIRLNQQMLPPDGQHVTLHCLRFAEAFKLEDYEKLKTGLDRLYDESDRPDGYWATEDRENYKEFLSLSKRAFLPGGWLNLSGFVSRSFAESNKKAPIMACVRELPQGVSSLRFCLFRMMPSMIVLVARIDPDEYISNSLNEIMLEQFEERSEKHSTGIRHISVTIVKGERIDTWIGNQQYASEAFIAKYFSGEFLSRDEKDIQCKCPSIKLYSLQDIPFTPATKLTDWLDVYKHFVQLIGEPFITYQFDNQYLMFEHSRFQKGDRPTDIRILTSESLFKAPEAHQMYGSIIGAIRYGHENAFDNFLALLAIDQVLRARIKLAIKHRNKLDEYCIDSNNSLDSKREQYSNIYNAKKVVSGDYYDFLRFRQELEYITSAEAEPWLYREAPSFEPLDNQHKRPDFVRGLVSNMRHLVSLLDGSFALLNTRYSDLFESVSSLSNFAVADSAYQYQKQLSILTWVLIILTAFVVALTAIMAVPVIIRFLAQ